MESAIKIIAVQLIEKHIILKAERFFIDFPTKLKNVYAFGLSVCLSIHLPNSNKYSLDILKLTCAIHI